MTNPETVDSLKPGDIILPPPRELSLWMRRHIAEANLPEAALHLTVLAVKAGAPDKRGPWTIVRARHSELWGSRPSIDRTPTFTFKARPDTTWAIIKRAEA